MMAKSKNVSPVDVATLTKAQAKVEHKRLALEIERHDQAYYQEDAPKISDAEYDALRKRFNAIEARFPEFVSGESPSQKVGAAPSGKFSQGPARACRCCRSTTPSRTRTCSNSSAVSGASSSSATTTASTSPPSRRSTGCRCRCATRAANWSPPPPAATAPRARTSPPMSGRSRTSRSS